MRRTLRGPRESEKVRSTIYKIPCNKRQRTCLKRSQLLSTLPPPVLPPFHMSHDFPHARLHPRRSSTSAALRLTVTITLRHGRYSACPLHSRTRVHGRPRPACPLLLEEGELPPEEGERGCPAASVFQCPVALSSPRVHPSTPWLVFSPGSPMSSQSARECSR